MVVLPLRLVILASILEEEEFRLRRTHSELGTSLSPGRSFRVFSLAAIEGIVRCAWMRSF